MAVLVHDQVKRAIGEDDATFAHGFRPHVVALLGDTAGNKVGVTTPTIDGHNLGGLNGLVAIAPNYMFNEVAGNWDRMRANLDATLLASAARTASTNTADQTNYNHRGVIVHLDITANPGGAETLTVEIYAKCPASGEYHLMTGFPAVAAATNAHYAYVLYPAAVETVNAARTEIQGLVLPRTWRARILHSAAGSWTYSLGAQSIL
jgi:hypothetical protein